MAGEGAPLRVALIGYGLAGRFFHRPLIEATPGMALATVVTADATRRAQVAAELPGAALVADAAELWAGPADHDLVVVAAATPAHVPLARAALGAGMPVVVDKPLAPTLSGARQLADAARRAGVAVVPFHNRRWDAEHRTVRRLLDEGTLGRVLRYESRFERWRPAPSPGAWREMLPGDEGGGLLLDLGVHLIDQAVTLFGRPRRVYAELEARRGGADDDVFLALEHEGGTRAHLWAGALAGAPGPRLRVLGTAGAYVCAGLDGQEAALRAGTAADDPGFGIEPPERWGSLCHGSDDCVPVPSERGQWPAFYAAVRDMLRAGGPPPVAAADAVLVLEVVEAARRSAARHQVVSL